MSDVPAERDWFADEGFWRATYDLMFPPSRFEAAATEVDTILALTGKTGGRVLDLACGPGRHSIILAERGFGVTAVDRSPFLLDRARARAREHGVDVEWIESDMRAFRRPASFDLALSLFTSFGYFRDDADNQRVLANVADSLGPAGVFVLDTIGKEVLARIFNPTSSIDRPNGMIVQRRRVVESWSRLENDWTLIEDGHATTFRFSHWIYSAREMERMLKAAGFEQVSAFGSYAGEAYGPGAARTIVVARMPAA